MLIDSPLEGFIFAIMVYVLALIVSLFVAALMHLISIVFRRGKHVKPAQ